MKTCNLIAENREKFRAIRKEEYDNWRKGAGSIYFDVTGNVLKLYEHPHRVLMRAVSYGAPIDFYDLSKWLDLYNEMKATATNCAYCDEPETPQNHFTIDHDVPLSNHGYHGPLNLKVACERCNKEKQQLSGAQYLRFLAKKNGIHTSAYTTGISSSPSHRITKLTTKNTPEVPMFDTPEVPTVSLYDRWFDAHQDEFVSQDGHLLYTKVGSIYVAGLGTMSARQFMWQRAGNTLIDGRKLSHDDAKFGECKGCVEPTHCYYSNPTQATPTLSPTLVNTVKRATEAEPTKAPAGEVVCSEDNGFFTFTLRIPVPAVGKNAVRNAITTAINNALSDEAL